MHGYNEPTNSLQQSRVFDKHKFPSLRESSDDESLDGIFEFTSPIDRPFLAAIDFASLLTFAAIGKASHSADGSLDITAVFITAYPFLFAWFSTSPITGIYSSDATMNGPSEAVKAAAKGWALAIPLGCVVRGILKGYIPPLPFVVVTLISTAVILGGTRALYSAAETKLS